MSKLKRILCPVDFSKCSAVAFEYALKLSQSEKCQLDVLHACNVPHYVRPDLLIYMGDGGARPMSEIAKEQAFTQLRQFIKERAPEAELEEHVVVGEPASSISATAERNHHDLIVMGTHGDSGFARFFFGGVAQKVVRTAPCPVLTMHAAITVETPRRVLVPVDFSSGSRAALSYVDGFTKPEGRVIDLLHVWEAPSFLPPDVMAGAQHGTQSLAALAKEQAYADIEAFAETARGQGIEIGDRRISFGPAARTIIDEAEQGKYDLIAMGTHGYSGFKHWMLGSVAEKVVRYATRPVLTVSERGRDSQAG